MNIQKSMIVLLSIVLLTACTDNKAESPKESAASGNLSKPDNSGVILEPDSWSDAVAKAIAASEAAQTAKTANEWKDVAALWSEAIELMKAVPESSEHYEVAQSKISEYQPNLEYAQTREEAEARKEAIIANGGWEILHTFEGSGMTNFCPSNDVFSVRADL
jgi:sulfur relay (sulfurtransferase) DsrC/TusE family protein